MIKKTIKFSHKSACQAKRRNDKGTVQKKLDCSVMKTGEEILLHVFCA